MESKCHTGRVIRYDTVSKLGWTVDIRTHAILVVVEKVLSEDWDPENGRSVPEFYDEGDCVVSNFMRVVNQPLICVL